MVVIKQRENLIKVVWTLGGKEHVESVNNLTEAQQLKKQIEIIERGFNYE